MELDLAAHGRNAKTVAVATDARDNPFHKAAGLGVIGRAEPQSVQRRHRPCAHGEDIAQDAANARRRALIGLDKAGMVVAFHLENASLPIADVDDSCILAGAANDLRAFGG